jgi:hypothetical protein
VGDRVVATDGAYKKECGMIIKIDNVDDICPYLVKFDNGGKYWKVEDYLEKEVPMSKYSELKQRIEAVQAWDKEADDILQELDKEGKYDIDIPTQSNSSIWIHSHNEFSLQTNGISEYTYTTQCEKLQAFKKALLWLLDHSEIKKDIVGQEVKADIEGKTYKVKILKEV